MPSFVAFCFIRIFLYSILFIFHHRPLMILHEGYYISNDVNLQVKVLRYKIIVEIYPEKNCKPKSKIIKNNCTCVYV
jgi:hypothetical protein